MGPMEAKVEHEDRPKQKCQEGGSNTRPSERAKSRDLFSLLLSQLSYPGYISTLGNVHYNYHTMTSEVFQTHRLLTSYE